MKASWRNAFVLFLTVLTSGCATRRADPSLVAHYAFDEGVGLICHDAGILGHDAELTAATWIPLAKGSALAFDGRSGHADCGPAARLGLKDRLTVSVWAFPQVQPFREAVLVGEDPETWAITMLRGNAYFYFAGGGNYCTSPVKFDQWVNLAGTFDGATMKFYLNGQRVGSKPLKPGTTLASKGKFVIAGTKRRSFFEGILEDVRIYNRALSEREVAQLASQPPVTRRRTDLGDDEAQAAGREPDNPPAAAVFRESGRRLALANKYVGIDFIQGDDAFFLSRLYGFASGQDFLKEDAAHALLGFWQIELRRDNGRNPAGILLNSRSRANVSTDVTRDDGSVTLAMHWQGLDLPDEKDVLDVEVRITLRTDDPLSRWRISMENRSRTWGLWQVNFPVLELRPIGNKPMENRFIVPVGRGIVSRDPFDTPFYSPAKYPGSMKMQFNALYHTSGVGLYLATHDGNGYKKTFHFTPFANANTLEYKAVHYPRNMGYPLENYDTTYDVCVGPFAGDWFDACQIYRKWALKQRWCAKGALGCREDIPRWYKESPVTLKTSTYSDERAVGQSRDRILAYLRFFESDLPIVWYGWKKHFPEMTAYNSERSPWKVTKERPRPCGNVHDGRYPEMPALDGFATACKEIASAGGYVKPYVCSRILDQGLDDDDPMREAAKPNTRRDINGDIDLVDRGVSYAMCYHTKWWQKRMRDTFVGLIKNENAGGIYFDTFYGGYVQCFDTSHGHSHGGGNDGYLGARRLALIVRDAMKRARPDAVMSGENPAETAIELLDGFLYPRTIRPDTIPLFATVYGDYICRFGRTAVPRSGGFHVQCASLFTEGAQMGRLNVHGNDHLKDFDSGSKYTRDMAFIRKLARFWKPEVGGRYLAYGQLLRPLRFAEPKPMPTVAYKASGGDKWKITVPALMSGVFRAEDGSVGIFVVNVSGKPVSYSFEMTPKSHPFLKSQKLTVTKVTATGERGPGTLHSAGIAVSDHIRPHDAVLWEAKPTP